MAEYYTVTIRYLTKEEADKLVLQASEFQGVLIESSSEGIWVD